MSSLARPVETQAKVKIQYQIGKIPLKYEIWSECEASTTYDRQFIIG